MQIVLINWKCTVYELMREQHQLVKNKELNIVQNSSIIWQSVKMGVKECKMRLDGNTFFFSSKQQMGQQSVKI